MADRIRLLKQIKIGDRWKKAPALFDTKDRIRKDHVLVDGKDELHPEGSYFMEWWEDSKRKQEAVGEDAVSAATRAQQKHAELHAVRRGVVAAVPETKRIVLKDAIEEYLDGYRDSLRTYRTYRSCLRSFAEFCPRQYVDEVTREDLVAYDTYGARSLDFTEYTRYNKMVLLAQFMKSQGKPQLLQKRDWPKVVEEIPEIYTPEELTALFEACTLPEAARYKFYLNSGYRDREGQTISWRDLDAKHCLAKVTKKTHWHFKPKTHEERSVPIAKAMVDLLLRYRPVSARPDDPIFPSSNNLPDGAMLEKLKAIAWRANLNCGHCVHEQELKDGTIKINRCAEGPYCSRWYLHKFRHTYATTQLRDGHDIRTVQHWLGHGDIKTTMKYLALVEDKHLAARLSEGSLAAYV